ncbi:8408_t:CDS:1, partial [Paraglomus occultum]
TRKRMMVVLKAKAGKNLNFKVSDEYNICTYFKEAKAKFWQLKHYLSFRLKNDETILPWAVVYNDWQTSLDCITKNYLKKFPTSIVTFCRELLHICEKTFEGSAVQKGCETMYNEFYQLNLDKHIEKNIIERIWLLDSTIFSEHSYSEFLQATCQKRIREETSSSGEKRIRCEETEL